MADISVVSANGWHIADNKAIYEPARSNNFEFIITGIDSLLKAGVLPEQADEEDFITNGQEIVRLGVNKATVPHFTQQEIVVNRGNTKTYYAGTMEFSEEPIDVIEYIGASGKSVLMAWQAQSGKPINGLVGRAADYKHDCFLIEYTPDYQRVRSWRLIGCWIKGLSEPEYTHENGDKRAVTATIRYDRAIPED